MRGCACDCYFRSDRNVWDLNNPKTFFPLQEPPTLMGQRKLWGAFNCSCWESILISGVSLESHYATVSFSLVTSLCVSLPLSHYIRRYNSAGGAVGKSSRLLHSGVQCGRYLWGPPGGQTVGPQPHLTQTLLTSGQYSSLNNEPLVIDAQ